MGKWEVAAFADVLDIKNGKSQKSVENPNGEYPIYGSGGVMGYADDYLCDGNTVIIGRKGTINSPIYASEPFWNVDTAFGLCPNEKKLFPKYLYYFCVRFDFEELNTTVTIPSLTKTNLLNIQIPMPPLPTQQKIADVLDRASALIEKRKAQIAKLDLLVKSQFVTMFGDPVVNPMGWEIKELRDFCDLMNGYAFKSSDYVIKSNVMNCRMSNIRPDGSFDASYNPKYLPDNFVARHKEFILQDGDVIIAMTDMANAPKILGVPTIVATGGTTMLLNQRVGKLVFLDTSNINRVYLMHYLSQPFIRKELARQAGTGLQVNIGKPAILSSSVLLPPLPLQTHFADFVRAVDKSKAQMQRGLCELELLYKALMQRCFSGEMF